ncbi:MAG: permease-like cell division protein FtsX [Deltaproteobacteria bacterium]|nr:permease-like cell division protein FtsX [Deltaproteobacteria bacterium]
MSVIPYIIPRTFSNMRGNWLSHLMTALTIAFVVLIFGLSTLIYFNLHRLAENYSREIRIVAYIDPALPPENIENLKAKVLKLRGVANIRYITSQEGYQRLVQQFQDEKDILAGLGEDFLPSTLEIEVTGTMHNLERIRPLVSELTSLPGITDVYYGKEWVERLRQAADFTRLITFAIGGLLLLTTIFVVSNTIKLTIYLRRNELETMRLVGATNFFIRGPFVLEGMLQGLVGSGLAMLALFALFEFLKTQVNFPGFIRFFSLVFLPIPVVTGIIAGSIILCAVVSAFSMRQFLRV